MFCVRAFEMLYKNIIPFGSEFASKLHLFVRLALRIIIRGYEFIAKCHNNIS